MANLGASAGWGILIGASLILGAIVAAGVSLPKRWAATLTAFGGGCRWRRSRWSSCPRRTQRQGPDSRRWG